MKAEDIQREYYRLSAEKYDDMHISNRDEHALALSFLSSMMDFFSITSILDVGSGTGRAISFLKPRHPLARIIGVEPVEALRAIGHSAGIGPEELVHGNVLSLDFQDSEFDLVCAFGLLHHVPKPARAVEEMLRVSRKAIFISDSNNFGQGSLAARTLKQAINAVRMWPFVNAIKTRGRGYYLSDGDGLAYSYSVFSNFRQISNRCSTVHLLNTIGKGPSPYRSAGHVALLGIR